MRFRLGRTLAGAPRAGARAICLIACLGACQTTGYQGDADASDGVSSAPTSPAKTSQPGADPITRQRLREIQQQRQSGAKP